MGVGRGALTPVTNALILAEMGGMFPRLGWPA